MKFKLYDCVHEFYAATFDVLMRHEAQNVIPLGNVIMGHAGTDKTEWRDPAGWLMATVSGDAGVILVALMTPPHYLTLYAKDNQINDAAIACLISGLESCGHEIPGVVSEKEMALRFSNAYCSAKNLSRETVFDQRIYELSRVSPEVPKIGTLRLAGERDVFYLPYWMDVACVEMRLENHIGTPLDAEKIRHRLAKKNFFILEDNGVPVSTAQITREMQTVCSIAGVYTPPFFRGRGYASSCVAQVSQVVLDRGYDKCVLYTDLANPISNSIYQKIGYTPICDSIMLKFVTSPVTSPA